MEQQQDNKSGGILTNPYAAFVVGLVGFVVLFVVLDVAVMRAQGLSLIFNG